MIKSQYKSVFIIAIFIAMMILSLAANQFFLANLNSDYLYVYETASNLWQNKSLAGQNFPAAPYYFPDIFVVMGLQFFTQNITVLHFLYSMIFLAAFTYLVYRLLLCCLTSHALALLGAFLSLISCFMIVPPDLIFLREWPASHLSVLLCSLFLLQYYIQHRDRHISLYCLSGIFILSFLVFISDNLLFAQAFFPLTVLILIDRFWQPNRKKLVYSLLGLFFLIALLGARMDLFLAKYFDASYSLNISLFRVRKLAQLGATLTQAGTILLANISLNKGFYSLLFFYNISSMIPGAALYVNQKSSSYKNLFFVLAYLYLAQISNVMLAILAGKFTDSMHLRYLDTIYIYPVLAFVFAIMALLAEKRFVRCIIAALTLLFIINVYLFIETNPRPFKNISFAPPYNEFVACVDQIKQTYPIQHGVGEYWDVREVRMLSKQHIQMTQINNELQFFNFIDNETKFKLTPKPVFNFIIVSPNAIISPLSKETIHSVIGVPNKIISCGYREVWLYTEAEPAQRLNQFFAARTDKIYRCL